MCPVAACTTCSTVRPTAARALVCALMLVVVGCKRPAEVRVSRGFVGPGGACFVVVEGGVRCLGSGAAANPDRYWPVEVPLLAGADEIRFGRAHACARFGDEVRCWGSNEAGQVGDGKVASAATPTSVLRGARSLAVGDWGSCVASSDGAVRCWGNAMYGLLGDRLEQAKQPVRTPTAVRGVEGAVEVAVGYDFACARRDEGDVWCWGTNDDRQLGRAGDGPKPARVVVAAATHLGGNGRFACVRHDDGGVSCWGKIGGWGRPPLEPTRIEGLTDALDVHVGADHACARRADGGVSCWGDSYSAFQREPQRIGMVARSIERLPPIDRLDAAYTSVVAVARDGTAYAWGDNSGWEIGNCSGGNCTRPSKVKLIPR